MKHKSSPKVFLPEIKMRKTSNYIFHFLKGIPAEYQYLTILNCVCKYL